MVGIHPVWNAHLNDGHADLCDMRLESGARSAVTAMQPFRAIVVHETVDVRIHSIVMVDLKAGIRPPTFEPPFCDLHNLHCIQEAV